MGRLVHNFMRVAFAGCPCIYLKEVTSERCLSQYFLDNRLEFFSVVAPYQGATTDNTSASTGVRCSINAIQDIYSFEDEASCFPAKVLALLTPEEEELLLMFVYCNDRGGTHRFCMLVENVQARDTLLEAMRIICFFRQSKAETAWRGREIDRRDLDRCV